MDHDENPLGAHCVLIAEPPTVFRTGILLRHLRPEPLRGLLHGE